MLVKQIAVFLENRSGRLLELAKVLERDKINLSALSIAETPDYGILRIITCDTDKAVAALKKAGYAAQVSELVAVEVADEPGGLVSVLTVLGQNNIGIEYLYSFARSQSSAVIFLKVADEQGAVKILQKNGVKLWNLA